MGQHGRMGRGHDRLRIMDKGQRWERSKVRVGRLTVEAPGGGDEAEGGRGGEGTVGQHRSKGETGFSRPIRVGYIKGGSGEEAMRDRRGEEAVGQHGSKARRNTGFGNRKEGVF